MGSLVRTRTMTMTIRMVLGFIMGVQMVAKIEVSALPQYLGQSLDTLEEGNLPLELGGLREDVQGGHMMDKRRGFDSMSGYTFGKEKRNFDEIDRAGFGAFVKRFQSPRKRNFDEIDRAGFGAFHKRNFDEIDRAGFGAFVKRSPSKRNFDEIDRAGFGAFHKRNF